MHVDTLDNEFTDNEIEGAIKHLKQGKAAGDDNIKTNSYGVDTCSVHMIVNVNH